MNPRVTIFMPCYLRPQRTQRALNCIARQSINDFEAIILGDNCPHFESYLMPNKGQIYSFNFTTHLGTSMLVNHGINAATSKYFMFMGNDDVIADDHLEHYLSEIEGTDLDFVYFNDWTLGKLNKTRMEYASIGHSNIIVRTDFLKDMEPHRDSAHHDWDLIKQMSEYGKFRKARSKRATYAIMTNVYNRVDPENID